MAKGRKADGGGAARPDEGHRERLTRWAELVDLAQQLDQGIHAAHTEGVLDAHWAGALSAQVDRVLRDLTCAVPRRARS